MGKQTPAPNVNGSYELKQHFCKELEGVMKEAIDQEYAYESKVIDDDPCMTTNEKIQAHRQSLGLYLAGLVGASFLSYFVYLIVNPAGARY